MKWISVFDRTKIAGDYAIRIVKLRQPRCKNAATLLQWLFPRLFYQIGQFVVLFQVLLGRATGKFEEILYEMRLVIIFAFTENG